MGKQTKNIIIFFLLLIIYIPILLITIFILGFSGIDHSCRYNDLICILHSPENIVDYLILYGVNLLIIIPLLIIIKKILKNETNKGE